MNYESQEPAGMEAGNVRVLTKPSPREVSERAYFYYLNAGSPDGHHLEDWFQAEQDLMLGQPRTSFHGAHS
jgi:hypothetical protein